MVQMLCILWIWKIWNLEQNEVDFMKKQDGYTIEDKLFSCFVSDCVQIHLAIMATSYISTNLEGKLEYKLSSPPSYSDILQRFLFELRNSRREYECVSAGIHVSNDGNHLLLRISYGSDDIRMNPVRA